MRPIIFFSVAWQLAFSAFSPAALAQPEQPPGAAEGVFVVESPGALFAFRVDPWSGGVHQVRGIGRCVFQPEIVPAAEGPSEVLFGIFGSYRPERDQTAEGVFVFSPPGSNRTQSVSWHGAFLPREGRFELGATVAAKDHAIGSAIPWTPPEAAAEPGAGNPALPPAPAGIMPPAVSPPAESLPPASGAPDDPPGAQAHHFRMGDFTDDVGDLDFGKIITAVFVDVPDPAAGSSTANQPPARGLLTGADFPPDVVDLAILNALTDIGKGITAYRDSGLSPEDVLRRALANGAIEAQPADVPLRQRGALPVDTSPPRTRQALVKPGTLPPDDPPPGSDHPLINEFHSRVPDVTGLTFENAVAALWKAGLRPSPVECLGHATDPAKADRIVAQNPAGGEPCPASGEVKLQWYTSQERPADPAGSEATGAMYRMDGSYRLNDGTHTFATLADNGTNYDFSLRVQFETNQGPYDRTSTMQGVLLEQSKDHLKIDVRSVSPAGQWGTGAVLFRRDGEGMTMEVGGRTIKYSR